MARRMHFARSQVALTHVADRARPDGLAEVAVAE